MRPIQMRTAPILLLCLALVACSPQKKLAKLLAKYPELARTDTITIRDTIHVPGDTIRATEILRDTIRIENERQVIRVVRIPSGGPCDTVPVNLEVEGVVKPDTVFYSVEVPVERLVPCPPERSLWWVWAIIAGLVLAVVALALKR